MAMIQYGYVAYASVIILFFLFKVVVVLGIWYAIDDAIAAEILYAELDFHRRIR